MPTIVAKREGILDLDLYDAPRKGQAFSYEDAVAEAPSDAETVSDGSAEGSGSPTATDATTVGTSTRS